jgi:hypothetical protein
LWRRLGIPWNVEGILTDIAEGKMPRTNFAAFLRDLAATLNLEDAAHFVAGGALNIDDVDIILKPVEVIS